jgi:hypothetical protein
LQCGFNGLFLLKSFNRTGNVSAFSFSKQCTDKPVLRGHLWDKEKQTSCHTHFSGDAYFYQSGTHTTV